MINTMEKKDKLCGEIALAVQQGTFPHGVLIECQNEADGEELARFTANCLLCQDENKPCGECSPCKKYQKGGHPDVFETDGTKGKSKSFTVDSVREIRSNAFIVPNESDKKIYILKNGQNMNEQAQNALLKILEEPPSYVYFIIVTTSKSTMLETVLSRVCVYSLVSSEAEISEKEEQAVKNFVNALLSIDELSLMEETAAFQKNSQFARSVLVLLAEILRDALVKKSGFCRDFRFPDEVNALCGSLTSKSLMKLEQVCGELTDSIDRNCNNNLLVVRMCYEFKRAMGR